MSKEQQWTRWIRAIGATFLVCALFGHFDLYAVWDRPRGQNANFRRLQITAGTEYSDSPDPWSVLKGLRISDFNATSNYTLASTVDYAEHSPLAQYICWVGEVLRDPHQKQIVWAVLFGLLGLVLTVTGARVWEYFLPLLVGIFFAGFAFYEEETLQLVAGEGTTAQVVVVLQVGVTLTLATYSGFDGTQLLVGSILGFLGSWITSSCLTHVDQQHPGVITTWCCFGSFIGALMLIHESSGFYLATLTSLCGSYLAVVGCGTVVSSMGVPGGILPKHSLFVDVAEVLLGNSGIYGLSCIGFFGAAGALRHRLAGIQTDSERSKVDKQAAAFGAIGIVGMMLGSTTGFGCQMLRRCPDWLEPVDKKAWPFFGGLAWAVFAFLGTWAQLANMSPFDSPREFEKTGRRHKRNTVVGNPNRGSRNRP